MRADGNRDFAAVLDDLIAAALSEEPEQPGAPNIPFDYLSVAEELHSGRIRVSPDVAAAGYRETDATADAAPAAADAPQEELLPSTEPEAIWNELGLTEGIGTAELGRKRRAFAFKNHPDRVAPHLRQRAMVRMQLANMLIDEVEQKAKRGRRWGR